MPVASINYGAGDRMTESFTNFSDRKASIETFSLIYSVILSPLDISSSIYKDLMGDKTQKDCVTILSPGPILSPMGSQ